MRSRLPATGQLFPSFHDTAFAGHSLLPGPAHETAAAGASTQPSAPLYLLFRAPPCHLHNSASPPLTDSTASPITSASPTAPEVRAHRIHRRHTATSPPRLSLRRLRLLDDSSTTVQPSAVPSDRPTGSRQRCYDRLRGVLPKMGFSIIDTQEQVIIKTIANITNNDWKVLVLDEFSKKIIYNVVNEDNILNKHISNVELIEERRDPNPTMDAIYILSPQPHIVDCLMADLDRRRYRSAYLVWTSVLDPKLRARLDNTPSARQQIAGFETLAIDFFARESHLVTFRDPWSFPILFHPDCNDFVRPHMEALAQKIASVCISAGEYPKVRYYRPRTATHEASVLCTHLARFVQDELDEYARWDRSFPPASSRPPSVLLITDRSMDLLGPLLHEFTYQAMAHDLLPIKDGDRTTFHLVENAGSAHEEAKDVELQEADSVWVDNRHRHMKDTITKLAADFQRFLEQNPQFTDDGKSGASLNTIKDMMAGLPQFQATKAAYSLHLTMAQQCMDKFAKHKLPDVAAAEQTMATGTDEDGRKPRNMLEEVARLLDDDAVPSEDRVRLVALYAAYRNGIIAEDLHRLLAHAALPASLFATVANLALLGGRPVRPALKDPTPPAPAVFAPDARPKPAEEGFHLSRYEPAVRTMLDQLCRGQLDPTTFPYVNPPLDPSEDATVTQASLRAAQPRWASDNRRAVDNRQRLFVYVAGGATYAESRACYEAAAKYNKDVVLATSHMLTPHLFLRQLGDLSADPRQLDIPLARPRPKAPAHLFEREAPKPPPPPPQAPIQTHVRPPGGLAMPTKQLGQMSLGSGSAPPTVPAVPTGKEGKEGKEAKLHKDKKKRNIFGMKK